MKIMENYLLGIYTRSPLHVGSGTSVDIVDLPIMRERITNYPVIPSSSLKGVISAEFYNELEKKQKGDKEILIRKKDSGSEILFGSNDPDDPFAGAMFFGEAKLLAFPVRSLKGCFAWISCPLVLQRFSRDTGYHLAIPNVEPDKCFAPDNVMSSRTVVLEEYPLEQMGKESWDKEKGNVNNILEQLKKVCDDPVWQTELEKRLVIVNDENFQHFVTATTEIVSRIKMDPKTRTNENLFNEEHVPNETLFYSVCRYLGERKDGAKRADETFKSIFKNDKTLLQIGGNETVGLGLCEVKLTELHVRTETETNP